ncbi:unnamed protein product [Prunus armeniaca]|uniref:Uncharacterized protein n=1 Tax=Prunus armeniaca TaxID=36596 RepID=A0A6J5TWS3_PRUAR|nr:unnamed protein product [Prunus armeniaca]
MLDATDCDGLEEIPHGVLSNLRRLEELYMAESFLNWGPATGSKDETSMASLDEILKPNEESVNKVKETRMTIKLLGQPHLDQKLLVNLQHVHIYACENMETIVQAAASTEDNIHEEGKEIGGSGAMTLFPKLLNSFHLAICQASRDFALMTIPLHENLSDDHVRGREESGGASSSTGSGCSPLVCFQSRPSTRNFTQILPQVVNREVTPTNLQTSSASDNLEHLEVDWVRFIGSDIFGSGNPFYSSI